MADLPDHTRFDLPTRPLRAVGMRLLGLFSSIRLGITLLVLLFVYSSVGSAGLLVHADGAWQHFHVREMRGLEMTEFEWFHWWPFDLLIALICVNIVVATIRRIPFNALRLGVWMIHTGIIVLALGSVWYFSTKIEGDAFVARRSVVIRAPGAEPVRLVAAPGNATHVETPDGPYTFRVVDTDPEWVLRSGEDAGSSVYAVSVMVEGPARTFVRQLLDGYPEYTEDVIPGVGRAVKETGEAILDPTLELSLVPEPQPWFYLMNSGAVYVREAGATRWSQRPIQEPPLYNDYLPAEHDVVLPPEEPAPPVDPLMIPAPPASTGDPLPGTPLVVDAYLRYATMTDRLAAAGGEGEGFRPGLSARFETDDGRASDVLLLADDPERNAAARGSIRLERVRTEEEFARMTALTPPSLRVEVVDSGVVVEHEIDLGAIHSHAPAGEDAAHEHEFVPVEGTGYAYRVFDVERDLTIPGRPPISVARLEIRGPAGTFKRWVFNDPALNRDYRGDAPGPAGEGPRLLDENIRMGFEPGTSLPSLLLVAGPDPERLRVVNSVLDPARPAIRDVAPGERVRLVAGTYFTVTRYEPRARLARVPAVVPRSQRDRDLDLRLRMIRVRLPEGSSPETVWLPYHDYAFRTTAEAMGRFPFTPSTARLSDGRTIELLFARERRPLPDPVILEDFTLATHVGGFSGNNLSVRNWFSDVRFLTDEPGEAATATVSVNNPGTHRGFSFFQAMWDPPSSAADPGQPAYKGLNYTILGVGNRNGVWVMLFGCTLAVVGMFHAFYIKPILKRRRQERVIASLDRGEPVDARPERGRPRPAFVGVGGAT